MIRNNTQIRLLIGHNPHRYGSMDFIRFNLILGGLTSVGNYVDAHNLNGGLGNTWNAKRYLRYMVERGQMELTNNGQVVVFNRRRSHAIAPIGPISVQLSDFTFGVEIECMIPTTMTAAAVAQAIRTVGVDCREEHLNHSTRTYWKIVSDGSLGNYVTGKEFVSPVLRGEDGFRQLELVCRKLKELNCKVNKRCGFHVHVGQEANANNAAYFTRLLRLYSSNEATIDTVMAPSRRGSMGGNGFCQSVRAPRGDLTSVSEVCRSVGSTGNRSSARYRKLNVDCWWMQRTVEFRQHSGTVDADKACNWVQFCLRFAALAASDRELPVNANLQTLLTALQLGDELQTFFLNRAARFAAAPTMARAA